MTTEVIYPDGSISEFHEDGPTIHSGDLAIQRLRLITAKSALGFYIQTDGKMEITRGGAQMSIENVIAPITGKKYKRSMNGKREALDDCLALLAELEGSAVVWKEDV